MGEMSNAYKIWLENLKGRDHSEDLNENGRIILKWILGKYAFGVWIGFIWLRIGTGSSPARCEHGNEPSGSTKCGEFLD
jgi:hypothetical protein